MKSLPPSFGSQSCRIELDPTGSLQAMNTFLQDILRCRILANWRTTLLPTVVATCASTTHSSIYNRASKSIVLCCATITLLAIFAQKILWYPKSDQKQKLARGVERACRRPFSRREDSNEFARERDARFLRIRSLTTRQRHRRQ
jgi:hypothetical protein